MQNRILLLSGGLLAVIGVLAFAESKGPEVEAGYKWADRGQHLFETHNCDRCHSVKAAGIESKITSDRMKAGDLSGYKGGKDLAALAAYMRQDGEIDGKKHRLKFKGSDEELQAIVDWLGSLEAQER